MLLCRYSIMHFVMGRLYGTMASGEADQVLNQRCEVFGKAYWGLSIHIHTYVAKF